VPQHQLLDPVFRLGFAHLQALGLSFEAWQFYPQLHDVADLARAFPDTNIIVNHAGGILGLPPHNGKRDEVFRVWRENLRALTKPGSATRRDLDQALADVAEAAQAIRSLADFIERNPETIIQGRRRNAPTVLEVKPADAADAPR
jgi:predicted TIM-barrel fold metal-dependent hydrolase